MEKNKNKNKNCELCYKEAFETIEKIATINNEDEKDKVLLDIYKIAHLFGDCQNPHLKWQKEYERIKIKLKDC